MSEDADSKMVKCNVCGNDHKEFLRLEFKDLEIAPYKNGIYYICVPCVLRSLGVKPEKSEGGYVLVGASEHEVQIIREQLAKQGIETTDPYAGIPGVNPDGSIQYQTSGLPEVAKRGAIETEESITRLLAEAKEGGLEISYLNGHPIFHRPSADWDALKKATEEREKE